jgi:hypothetical protein
MKSTFGILSLFVALTAMVPRQSFGQYAWIPVYSDAAATEAYNSAPNQTGYATYVDEDLEDFDSKKGDCEKGGKSDCGCSSCRSPGWLSRSFGSIEYLHWYQKGSRLPPIFSQGVTTSREQILFGGNFVNNDRMAGLRVTGGVWLDDCKDRAVLVRAFGSEGASTPFAMNVPNAGFPFAGIPFFNTAALPGSENGLQVAQPLAPLRTGTLYARASTDVYGGDAIYKTMLDRGCDYRFDLLAGYQYSRIDDDLEIRTTSGFPPLPNNAFTTSDLFDVSNDFNGGTLGLSGDFNRGSVSFQMMGKLGIGNMRQSVAISGNNTLANGLPTQGGFFAQPPNGPNGPNGVPITSPFNIGEHDRNVFAFSPEASVKMTWCLKDNLSLSVGYTFLYWNHVALAGDQIDRRGLNSTGSVNQAVLFGGNYAGGGANPGFTFRDTDYFVHTIDIGGTLRY